MYPILREKFVGELQKEISKEEPERVSEILDRALTESWAKKQLHNIVESLLKFVKGKTDEINLVLFMSCC
ncbi:MAG: hypothetical protein AB1466_06735 [Actinomycetota bacterium]